MKRSVTSGRRLDIVSFLVLLGLTVVPAQAQHRYLGETGAKVFQCAKFYTSPQAVGLCIRGDELSAGQIERLGLVDRNSRIGQYGGQHGYESGDGYFYHTDSTGRPLGTRERIVTGGAIGATLGAGIGAIFDRGGTGALLGAGIGAIFGAKSGSKANKKAKLEAEVREANVWAEAQTRAEAVETASREQKLLRNRFDSFVRVIMRSPDGQIEDLILDPGQSMKINPPRGSQLVLAEVETYEGKWIRLEHGSGMVRLPHNSGWEFGNPSSGS